MGDKNRVVQGSLQDDAARRSLLSPLAPPPARRVVAVVLVAVVVVVVVGQVVLRVFSSQHLPAEIDKDLIHVCCRACACQFQATEPGRSSDITRADRGREEGARAYSSCGRWPHSMERPTAAI